MTIRDDVLLRRNQRGELCPRGHVGFRNPAPVRETTREAVDDRVYLRFLAVLGRDFRRQRTIWCANARHHVRRQSSVHPGELVTPYNSTTLELPSRSSPQIHSTTIHRTLLPWTFDIGHWTLLSAPPRARRRSLYGSHRPSRRINSDLVFVGIGSNDIGFGYRSFVAGKVDP